MSRQHPADNVEPGAVSSSEDPPSWAAALSAGAAPGLVAACVALLARPAMDAGALRRELQQRLETGQPTDPASVAAALAGSRPREPRPVAEALLAAGARLHVVGQPGYPRQLTDAWPELGAPLWLAVRSPSGCLPAGPAVAVVGTRHPSLDGLRTARGLGRLLARHGVTVVSGLARGIDQEAHRGALDAGGATAAVLGTGLDVAYPAGDERLRQAVADAGGLASELPLGAPPRAHHFLARNRIISGLADATVVVEGRARSGALQTARMAASQGREVFAVPGSLHQPTARGPLDLIRDGARCLTRLEDVLDVLVPAQPSLEWPEATGTGSREPAGRGQTAPDAAPLRRGLPTAATSPGSQPRLGPDAAAVHALLGPVPANPESLARAAGLSMPATLVAVGELLAHGLAAHTAHGVSCR